MARLFLLFLLTMSFCGLNAQVDVVLHIDQKLADSPFEYNVAASSEMGYSYMVSRLQYYVSEIKLIHDGGQVSVAQDLYLLIDASQDAIFPLGNFDITDLEEIQFSIGVDSAHNHLDPATYPSDHPLALQDPSMHWGWFSGYRFIALEGKAGPNENEMTYNYGIHTIGDVNYYTINLQTEGQLNGNVMTINITADNSRFLDSVDVSNGLIFHSTHGPSRQIMLNTRSVFSADATTLVADPGISGKFEISPSPSHGLSNIHFEFAGYEKFQLLISDLTGRVVYKKEISGNDSGMELQLNNAPGLYLVSLWGDQKLLAQQKLVLN